MNNRLVGAARFRRRSAIKFLALLIEDANNRGARCRVVDFFFRNCGDDVRKQPGFVQFESQVVHTRLLQIQQVKAVGPVVYVPAGNRLQSGLRGRSAGK